MGDGRGLKVLLFLATVILIVIALYFGQPVLMPLAVAMLLSFLLSPVADALHRLGIGRTTSVVFLVILVFFVVAGGAYTVGSQLAALAAEIPKYKGNIREKLVALREAGRDSPIEQLQQTVREIRGEIERSEKTETNLARAETAGGAEPEPNEEEEEPVPVVLKGKAPEWLPNAFGPLLEMLATTGLVVVLVIFMLLRRRELRNRFILLFGYGRMPLITHALDEAGERISRYLLTQTIINAVFGAAAGIGLYFIGVPYALLWGFLAAALRFIPYVGPWLGASMPLLLSLAVFPGWLWPLLVLGLFLLLELTTNMILEPHLYGQSAGVSEVALLAAVAFWTWIWGPVGLALATPLTVCLVVLGKHVPGLGFIQLMLGDESVMNPETVLYQRLLAMDKSEAAEIAAQFAKNHELHELYDDLLLPALVLAKRDLSNQRLSREHLQFIFDTLIGIARNASPMPLESTEKPAQIDHPAPGPFILCIPAEDRLDEAALLMLRSLLPAHAVDVVPGKPLSGEMVDLIARCHPAAVCIAGIAPGGTMELRHLTKRVRARFPELRLVAGRFGVSSPTRVQALSAALGVNISTTLSHAKSMLLQYLQLKPDDTGLRPEPAPPARLDIELARQ